MYAGSKVPSCSLCHVCSTYSSLHPPFIHLPIYPSMHPSTRQPARRLSARPPVLPSVGVRRPHSPSLCFLPQTFLSPERPQRWAPVVPASASPSAPAGLYARGCVLDFPHHPCSPAVVGMLRVWLVHLASQDACQGLGGGSDTEPVRTFLQRRLYMTNPQLTLCCCCC